MRWPWRRRPPVQPEPWEALIVPPRVLYTGQNDALRRATEARRETAQRIRDRAAQIEAGEMPSEGLRRVR